MPLRAPGASGGTPIASTRGGGISWVRLEGAQTPIIDFVKGNLPAYIQGRYGRHRSAIPVGLGKIPVFVKGGGVPQLPGPTVKTPTFTGSPLPEPIVRQDPPQDYGIVQVTQKLADFLGTGLLSNDQWNRAMRGDVGTPAEIRQLLAKQASIAQPKSPPKPVAVSKPAVVNTPVLTDPKTAPIAGPVKPTTTGGSMDLGSIITDLGTTYIKSKYAQTPTPTVQPVYSLPELAGDVVDFFVDPATQTIQPVAKQKKRCRRRRRRLATKSDLGDLAALKAILGNGEAFKAWIATHSR